MGIFLPRSETAATTENDAARYGRNAMLPAAFGDCGKDWNAEEDVTAGEAPLAVRADDGDRTRDPQLGKLMLYQLSYVREAVPV